MFRTQAMIIVGAVSVLASCKKEASDRPAGLAPSSAPAATAAAPAPVLPAPPALPPAETVPAAPDPKQTIGGTITLPSARKRDVKKGDIMFVIARRAGGPPGPGSMLATQKLVAGDFPMAFLLSSRDAMLPNTPFEGPVNITVRVDKDGDAMTRKKGDVFGAANDIKVGAQAVTIPLDTLQAEDQILGGGMMPGAAPPPGHGQMPPGHP